MPRISDCAFKEGGCDDPRCKRGLCILERDREARVVAREGAAAATIRTEAEAVIIDRFYIQGRKKPSPEQIARLSDRPEVVEEAKRRIAERKSWSERRPFRPPN